MSVSAIVIRSFLYHLRHPKWHLNCGQNDCAWKSEPPLYEAHVELPDANRRFQVSKKEETMNG